MYFRDGPRTTGRFAAVSGFDDLVRTAVRDAVRELIPELRAELQAALARGAVGPASEGGLLTIREAAKFAAVHRKTISRWIRSGQLVALGEGKLTRVRRSDLEAQFRAQAPDGTIDFAARARMIRDGKK